MYSNGFILGIKDSKGNVLKEFNDKVRLPFYEEYKIYLRNKNKLRAKATVLIDGEDVLNGRGLVLDSDSSLDLERFVSDLKEGRKFQFVPDSDKGLIGKDKNQLGLIEVRVWKEKYQAPITIIPNRQMFPENRNFIYCCASLGGTIKGSRSTQSFKEVTLNELEEMYTTLSLRLIPSEETYTTRDSIYCVYCGTKLVSQGKYCHKCGNESVIC